MKAIIVFYKYRVDIEIVFITVYVTRDKSHLALAF